jgi:GH24 family phage-related lysozyme (muramidase)
MFDDVFADIRKSMIEKEGIRNDVYLDSLGYPTVGIGHLVKPEDNLKVGDRISTQRVEALFKDDVTDAILAAIDQAKQIGEFEKDFITALTHVNFQLGIYWYKKWPNTWNNLVNGRYQRVINSVMNSLWHKQTPKRTTAFKMALLQEIAENNRRLPTTQTV